MAEFNRRYWMLWDEMRDKDPKIKRAEFAERMGVTIGQSNGWLDAGTEPDCESLLMIARNAKVSVSWLVGETNARNLFISDLFKGLSVKAMAELDEFTQYLRFKYRTK